MQKNVGKKFWLDFSFPSLRYGHFIKIFKKLGVNNEIFKNIFNEIVYEKVMFLTRPAYTAVRAITVKHITAVERLVMHAHHGSFLPTNSSLGNNFYLHNTARTFFTSPLCWWTWPHFTNIWKSQSQERL
jgi:hypothetical protein